MHTVKVICAGKINLSLNILGRGERLHYLDSIMRSVGLGDIVTATVRPDNKINISFTGADFVKGSLGQNNSVKKAIDLLKARFGEFGADVVVEKNLPVGGGLGGSSADAAGALLALNALYDFDKDGIVLFEIAKTVGSDVPFSMHCARIIDNTSLSSPFYHLSSIEHIAARVTGTGDVITPIKNDLKMHIVIAMEKGSSVNSGDAYRVFDEIYPDYKLSPSDNDALEKALKTGDPFTFSLMGNALTVPSENLCGEIKKTRNALCAAGAFFTLMTGSGCCIVGFFKNAEEAEKAAEKLRQDGFWAKVCE